MEEIKTIPHFHGVNLTLAGIEEDKKIEFFNLFRNGNVPYYSEAILKNAYIKYLRRLSQYEQLLLDNFYSREIENAFGKELSEIEFCKFQQHYVNLYKRCFGPSARQFLEKDLKNTYKDLEIKFQQVSKQQKIPISSIIGNLNMYSPSAKESVEGFYVKREQIKQSLLEIKGKRKAGIKEKRERLMESLKENLKNEDKAMQENAFDPFVAMSKLPRHATMFAIDKNSFQENYNQIINNEVSYLFLGMVFCSFHKEDEYLNSLHYDTLIARRMGKEILNGHYINQVEVDFHKIEPETLKFAFPVIIARYGNELETKTNIMQMFGFTEEEYDYIEASITYSKGTKNPQIYYREVDPTFDSLVSCYSNIILERAKTLARNQNRKLCFANPNGELIPFENKEISEIQNCLIVNSEKSNQVNFQQPFRAEPRAILTKEELIEKSSQVDKDILLKTEEKDLETVKKFIQENLISEEKYETVCNDRIISHETPNLSRTEMDELLAITLQAKENNRYFSFVKREQLKQKSTEKKSSSLE